MVTSILRGKLASVVWAARASYHNTLCFTSGKAVFGRNMLFKITAIVDFHVIPLRIRDKSTLVLINKKIDK